MTKPLEVVQVVKAKPEHMSNLVMTSGYGMSVFLEHQYLVLMTVVYLFVTVVGVGHEVNEIHSCTPGKHER